MNHRICLKAVLCVLWFHEIQGSSFPESPCPDMYGYEWSADNNMWCGIISLMTPPQFSRLNLDVKLSSPVPISSSDYGSLELKEKQQSLNRLAGKIVSQERTPLQYLVIFPKNKPIPKLINISINNDVLCESKVPDIHYSTISLNAKINTGLNVPINRGEDFKSDSKNIEKPAEPPQDTYPNYQTQMSTNTNTHMKMPSETVEVLQKEPEEMNDEECGLSRTMVNPLVIRGTTSEKGDWPWQVAIFKKDLIDGSSSIKFICGGTLISRRHIVTAAHCVVTSSGTTTHLASSFVLYLGKHDVTNFVEKDQQVFQVSEVVPHEHFSYDNMRNDIAIMLLSEKVEITQYVRPACISLKSSKVKEIVNQVGTVVGWGKDETGHTTTTLRIARIIVVAKSTCMQSDYFFRTYATEKTFCAGFNNGTTVCNGDSGGGMVFLESNSRHQSVWYLRGIVSVGKSDFFGQSCDTNSYVVFTDVVQHLSWINTILKRLNNV